MSKLKTNGFIQNLLSFGLIVLMGLSSPLSTSYASKDNSCKKVEDAVAKEERAAREQHRLAVRAKYNIKETHRLGGSASVSIGIVPDNAGLVGGHRWQPGQKVAVKVPFTISSGSIKRESEISQRIAKHDRRRNFLSRT